MAILSEEQRLSGEERTEWRGMMAKEQITLVRPSLELKTEFISMAEEFAQEGGQRYQFIYQAAAKDFPRFVRMLEERSRPGGFLAGQVPETTFWTIKDGATLLGSCRLRQGLTRALRHEGGHIGYDIRPSERGKGYGTRQLDLVLKEASSLGLRRVLITCNTDNIGSARVIIKNGGILENRVTSHYSGKSVDRYWIYLGKRPARAAANFGEGPKLV